MALPNLNRQELFFRPKPHFYSLMKTKEESSVLKAIRQRKLDKNRAT